MWPDEVEIVSQRIDGDGFRRTTGQRIARCRISDISQEIVGADGVMFAAKFEIFFPLGTCVHHTDVINVRRKRGHLVISDPQFTAIPVRAVRDHGMWSSRYRSVVC